MFSLSITYCGLLWQVGRYPILPRLVKEIWSHVAEPTVGETSIW
jgi:hypothetical protein